MRLCWGHPPHQLWLPHVCTAGGSPLPPLCSGWVSPGWVTPGGALQGPHSLSPVSLSGSLPDADGPLSLNQGCPLPWGLSHTHTHTYALCTSSQGSCLPNTSSSSPHCVLSPWSPRGLGWAQAPSSLPPCLCMALDKGRRVRLMVPLPQTIKPRWSVQSPGSSPGLWARITEIP